MATHESKRGRGFGRCVVEAVEDVARALNIPRLLLCRCAGRGSGACLWDMLLCCAGLGGGGRGLTEIRLPSPQGLLHWHKVTSLLW